MTEAHRILLTTALAATLLLAACGQRGDLYLPTPQKSPVPSAPCAETTPAAPSSCSQH